MIRNALYIDTLLKDILPADMFSPSKDTGLIFLFKLFLGEIIC